MTVRFLPRTMDNLDTLNGDLLALCVFQDERPLRGLNGLVDWRAKGRVSRFLLSRKFEGSSWESLLASTPSAVAAERLLVFGLGPKKSFSNLAFAEAVGKLLDVVAGIQPESLVMEIPGTVAEEDYFLERLAILAKNLFQKLDIPITLLVEEGLNLRELNAKYELIRDEVERLSRKTAAKKKAPPPLPEGPVFGKPKAGKQEPEKGSGASPSRKGGKR